MSNCSNDSLLPNSASIIVNCYFNINNNTSNNASSAPPPLPAAECLEAFEMLNGGSLLMDAVRLGHLLVASLTILLTLLVAQQYRRLRIAIHANLALLFANILLLYVANAASHLVSKSRHQFLLLTTDPSRPCQLLTPVWLSVVLLAPNYVYSAGIPLFHFAVMAERLRATIWLRSYEQQGLGRWMVGAVVLVWTLSLGYLLFVVLTSLADPSFGGPQAAIYLTTDSNARFINGLIYGSLTLLAITCAGDWLILRVNARKSRERRNRGRRTSSASTGAYSLSQNYQLGENLLSMRLILPLDVSYALLYSLYSLLVLLIRFQRSQLSKSRYIFYYDCAMLLLFLHNIVTLIIYVHFIHVTKRCRRRRVQVRPEADMFEMYFKELEAQWR